MGGWSVAAVRSITSPSQVRSTDPIFSALGNVPGWSANGSAIGLRREDYRTHSLGRTKAALIYRQTGNLRAVQILLGHTKIESTVRYLGVDVEDALALAEPTEV